MFFSTCQLPKEPTHISLSLRYNENVSLCPYQKLAVFNIRHKNMTSPCSVCVEIRPKLFKNNPGDLIKATEPFERLNVDFEGPVPSKGRNCSFLTLIYEYSRLPFVSPCKDMSTSTVIECFHHLFSMWGKSIRSSQI